MGEVKLKMTILIPSPVIISSILFSFSFTLSTISSVKGFLFEFLYGSEMFVAVNLENVRANCPFHISYSCSLSTSISEKADFKILSNRKFSYQSIS